MNLSKLSNVPTTRDMISHTIRTEGSYPRTRHIAVCEYPDCTREFDGSTWRVTVDKRPGAKPNLFNGTSR